MKKLYLAGMMSLLMMMTGCGAGGTATAQQTADEAVTVNVGSLKGPTTIGLAELIESEPEGYEFTIETQADVLLADMVSGDLDIALVPANVASVLYNKTDGAVSVIDINTLGVLYMVSGDDGIESMEDLAGRTIYTTGMGSTPEYVLRYLLEEYGLTDVNVEFKSEATEVVATLTTEPAAIGMLPQPFATVALKQNEALGIVLDMTQVWDELGGDSRMVTGVTVVRNEFLEEHPQAVERFLEDHAQSAEYAVTNVAETAAYVVDLGIIEKAPVAEAAIPYCNIVCISGDEMKTVLSGYLQVLYDSDPASVGGNLPAEDFYY